MALSLKAIRILMRFPFFHDFVANKMAPRVFLDNLANFRAELIRSGCLESEIEYLRAEASGELTAATTQSQQKGGTVDLLLPFTKEEISFLQSLRNNPWVIECWQNKTRTNIDSKKDPDAIPHFLHGMNCGFGSRAYSIINDIFKSNLTDKNRGWQHLYITPIQIGQSVRFYAFGSTHWEPKGIGSGSARQNMNAVIMEGTLEQMQKLLFIVVPPDKPHLFANRLNGFCQILGWRGEIRPKAANEQQQKIIEPHLFVTARYFHVNYPGQGIKNFDVTALLPDDK